MNGFTQKARRRRPKTRIPWVEAISAGAALVALIIVLVRGASSLEDTGHRQAAERSRSQAVVAQRVGFRQAPRSLAAPLADGSEEPLVAFPEWSPRGAVPAARDGAAWQAPTAGPHGAASLRPAELPNASSPPWGPNAVVPAAYFNGSVEARPPYVPHVVASAPNGNAETLPARRWSPEPSEALPPPPGEYQIPVFDPPGKDTVDITTVNGRVSLVARNTPLSQIVALLAQAQGFNVVCAQDITSTVSIVLSDVAWQEALTAVLSTAGYTWVQTGEIIRVTSISAGKSLAPDVQGRVLQVFPLDYAAGSDLERSIRGLLSPAGQVFLAESSASNSRKPKDVIVVEDLPEFMDRIVHYIAKVDRAPRQVLIEAHVLEVKLAEDSVHGVDFKHLFSVLNNSVELQLSGMTTPLPTPPAVPTAFMARVGGGNLAAVIECLQTTQNAKTLAAPRVLVVDGQEANIQVGEKLPYQVKTTTETSTVQDVQFLDVGVILTVTPHIARDGRVLMKVKPKVSTGHINANDLPEEKTSEVDSQVLLEDGQGIIIGGLIQEKDTTDVQKLPILGDLWLIGSLFQRRRHDKHRTEVVVALVPYVQPLEGGMSERDHVDMMRCQTPLLTRSLAAVPRPWEDESPDPLRPPGFLRDLSRAEPAMVEQRWPGHPVGGHAESHLHGLPDGSGRHEVYADPPQSYPDRQVPAHAGPDPGEMSRAMPASRAAGVPDFQREPPVLRLPATGAP